jgi:glycosyltransferase involved in cell wall biosynthesis
MAVYNAGKFLREAIASILAQTYGNFELVVVDDCSSDDSLAILKSFEDPRMRIIEHQANLGAALSRNAALSVARGEYVAVMDADDLSAPTRLERQVAFLDMHPDVGLTGCVSYENIDCDGNILCTTVLPEDNETIQKILLDEWCFLHSSIMFRKNLQVIIGGYRSAFEPIEDHDFVLRILEHTAARNHGENLVKYRLNPRGLSVAGHKYSRELRTLTTQLARARRSGQYEDLDSAIAQILTLKRERKAFTHSGGFLQSWNNSFHVARRFYEFGCYEFCEGHFGRSRLCFARSLRTNLAFVRSLLGFAFSLVPLIAIHSRFMFASSAKQHSGSELTAAICGNGQRHGSLNSEARTL